MVLSNPPEKTLETEAENTWSPESEPEEEVEVEVEVAEKELEELETEVKQMGKKVQDYRASLPGQLDTALASLLSAQRPVLPEFDSGTAPGPSGETANPVSLTYTDSEGQAKYSRMELLTEEDQKTVEKVRMLEDKIASNVSTLPIVLKRLKECMSKIDKLDSCNGVIHPAFKKKKTS